MKTLTNQKRIQGYLKKYKQYTFLSRYPLHLYQLEPHEILNDKLNPKQFLLFLVAGKIKISNIREDGSLHQITLLDSCTCFGDMEFAQPTIKQHIIETMSTCEFLAIDLTNERTHIEQDSEFLLFLLRSITEKTCIITNAQSETTDIESKVLYYLNNESNTHTIQGVEQLAQHINCSRRQLQRILKKLCDTKQIRKVQKGIYEKY